MLQIGDFGMSRDLTQDEIYESKGHNIPLRWTAPEVHGTCIYIQILVHVSIKHYSPVISLQVDQT